MSGNNKKVQIYMHVSQTDSAPPGFISYSWDTHDEVSTCKRFPQYWPSIQAVDVLLKKDYNVQ